MSQYEAPQQRPKVKISLRLLLLDVIGALLMALGFAEYLAGPGVLVAEAYRFPGYVWAMIIGGFAMTLPLILSILRQAGRARQGSSGTS